MEAKHVVTFSSSSSAGGCRTPVAVGVYRKSGIMAFPASCLGEQEEDSAIILHWLFNDKHLHFLSGHNSQGEVLEDLAFSPNITMQSGNYTSPFLLCSASSNSILLWDMEEVYQGEPYIPNELERRISDGFPVNDIEFSPDGLHVAICKGNAASIYSTERYVLETTLLGHTGEVFRAVFSSMDPLTVITLSEDRTFKVWNLEESTLLYQSHIVSASPFLCGTINMQHQQLATGTADGMIRIFDLMTAGFKCLLKCNVMKELDKIMTSQNTEHFTPSESGGVIIHAEALSSSVSDGEMEGDRKGVEMGSTIIGMFYISSSNLEPVSDGNDTLSDPYISDVLKTSSMLLVVMQLMLLRFNGHTLELIDLVDFTEPLLSLDPQLSDSSRCLVPAQSTFDFIHEGNEGYFISGGLFSSVVTVISLNPHSEKEYHSSDQESVLTATLSVLSSKPLLANSPLSCDLNPKTKSTGRPANTGHYGKTGRPSGGASRVLDQPLTFKSKVKSSGYTAPPRMKMFKPKVKISASSSISRNGDKKERSGDTLVCGCADNAVYSMRMSSSSPSPPGRTRAFVGHNGPILSTNWSHSDQWLVSGSSDKTACVWSAGSKDPALVLDRIEHNLKSSDKQTKLQSINHLFTREINFVQFYYLDKFLLLSSGNSTHLYKYHMDVQPQDDIKRYQNKFRYKLVTSLQMESSKSITALSAINDFHSYIVLLAGSNKTLEVYDMNVEKCVRTIPDAHSRATHCICQNKGSKYITRASESYDLFLTLAVMDGIKLWDLRANRCVCRYNSHVNSSQPTVTAAFSPCARYIASGSEDRSAYIYDLRHSSPLHRLSGHSETVSAVTYHPLKPMLVTSTFSGEVRFFTEDKIR